MHHQEKKACGKRVNPMLQQKSPRLCKHSGSRKPGLGKVVLTTEEKSKHKEHSFREGQRAAFQHMVMLNNVLIKTCCTQWQQNIPLMWAPGFTQSPNKMGVVAIVTVTITSAPVTASWAEEQTRTGPLTELANFTAFSLVRFHILTFGHKNKGKQNRTKGKTKKDRLTWRISPC